MTSCNSHECSNVLNNRQYIRLVLLLLRFEHEFSLIFPASVARYAFPTLWLKPLRLHGTSVYDKLCNVVFPLALLVVRISQQLRASFYFLCYNYF